MNSNFIQVFSTVRGDDDTIVVGYIVDDVGSRVIDVN
jgi:hypothetical protein